LGAYIFAYSIDDGPEPISKASVSNYIGTVSLYPVTDSGKIFVEWISTYESDSESEVGGFCNPIYNKAVEQNVTALIFLA